MPQEAFGGESLKSSPSIQQYDRLKSPIPSAPIAGTVAPGTTSHDGPHSDPLGGER